MAKKGKGYQVEFKDPEKKKRVHDFLQAMGKVYGFGQDGAMWYYLEEFVVAYEKAMESIKKEGL